MIRTNCSDLIYFLRNITGYAYTNNCVRAWWFSKIKNVGDLTGPYLIGKLTGKKVIKDIIGVKKHYLATGSILDQATSQSLIWGAGAIGSGRICMDLSMRNVFLLRGKLSLDELNHICKCNLSVPLADPAMLVSEYFWPKVSKQWNVGVVPHYSEYEWASRFFKSEGIKIIDVRQDVEDFVREILSCEYILSSSLHGLILSDTYEIPNLWVKFSRRDNDSFKFLDYYSVFCDDVLDFSPFELNAETEISSAIQRTNCRRFQKLINLVRSSFPG